MKIAFLHRLPSPRRAFFLAGFLVASAATLPVRAQAPAAEAASTVAIEAEDFQIAAGSRDSWKVVKNGEGNYMVDAIGFTHISGERLLSAPARAKNARAVAQITIPKAGDYHLWARFEQPVGTENRFQVTVRQGGKIIGQEVLGQSASTKYFFGLLPSPEAGAPWGWDGLVEQNLTLKNAQVGSAQIELVAVDQPAPSADRNIDLFFLTSDLSYDWRLANSANLRYPLLDRALAATPPRYYLRLTSPVAQTLSITYNWNRIPWRANEGNYKIEAGKPGAWMPLRLQDVAHFSTLIISGPLGKGLNVRAELAADPAGRQILRAIDWNDPDSPQLQISLPPYPNKYRGEKILTVEEQYRDVARYLATHRPVGGREPNRPLNWGNSLPLWDRGRLADAGAEVFRAMGMRGFIGVQQPTPTLPGIADVARERWARWNWQPTRSVGIGSFRNMPTSENIARAKNAAVAADLLPWLQRFDYGDEISFSEWLKPISDETLSERFAQWQQARNGKIEWPKPDSRGAQAEKNPNLFVDSMRFYEDAAIERVASQASHLPATFGPEILYGANYLAHPYYYPRIAPYVKWFRKTPSGDYAANFGRHSEYFWQVHQPGPMVNGYMAEHFRAGMRDNPRAVLQQYTMPHSPGNTDASFLRTAFTHLAHGARVLDFFGIGVQASGTENYIDFRDPSRYEAIRDVNRFMATVEDILPQSHVVAGKVALILSESTERWDLAAMTGDRASSTVEGTGGITANNPKVRLTYHQERLGIYYALVNNSRPPDLLTEDDVKNGRLKDYAVAYWVGDCAEVATVQALQMWVESGGRLTATAGALRFDEYRRPITRGWELLGLQSAELTEATRFVRPLIELPRLRPLDNASGMPALAVIDAVTPVANAQIVARFANGKPAVVRRNVGRGQTTYIATLPGLAYLWSAYQPPPIPSHGPSSHVVPQNFNRAAERFIIADAMQTATSVDTHGARIDARLLASPNGYAIPLANYGSDTNQLVSLTLRGVTRVRRISSARRGALKMKRERDGALTVRYRPGIGDILRVETF